MRLNEEKNSLAQIIVEKEQLLEEI